MLGGNSVEMADGKSELAVGNDVLEVMTERPEQPTTIQMGILVPVPELKLNLISEQKVAMISGLICLSGQSNQQQSKWEY